MKLEHEPYKPIVHENFWCNRCDRNKVDSLNEDSGKFFLFSGHAFNARTKSYDGLYEMVMHAICSTCLKETNIMMTAAEHWWNHLSHAQRDFIQKWLIERQPTILLKDVQREAFSRHAAFGWNRESGWPETSMRII